MDGVTLILLVVSGSLGAGLVIGFVWGKARTTLAMAPLSGEANSLATQAQATLTEVRVESEKAKQEVSRLQEALRETDGKRIAADTRRQEAQKTIEEQKSLLASARQELADTFKGLASEALKGNSQAFWDLAKNAFVTIQTEAKGDLNLRQQSIENMVKPLNEALTRYEAHMALMEKSRQEAYGGLQHHLQTLAHANEQLQRETGNLVNALRAPQVRGRWGEITLKRVVELAGMVEWCDFVEQESVDSGSGRLRPDMIVQLPAGRQIVVDAKTVLSAYLDALEAQDEESRKSFLLQHASQIRTHTQQLSAKAYWNQFPQAPEFVVLFLPGEQFLGAALNEDHTLIEDGFTQQVVVATPTTLVALLRAVAYGWRQEQVADNVQAMTLLGKDLYERMAVLANHFVGIGEALGKAVSAYNGAVGSLEARVLPAARKFKELGVSSDKDISTLVGIEQAPRSVPEIPEKD